MRTAVLCLSHSTTRQHLFDPRPSPTLIDSTSPIAPTAYLCCRWFAVQQKIVGRGKGGTILVHVWTNNTDKEGTTAIVEKYRKLLKKTKQARLGQIILSGILPVCGNRIQGYRNSKRMAVNGMVERLCQEEDVGYVDMWDSFVGNEELYFRDGLHLSGKGAAVLAEGLSGAVASGLGKVRYLN